MQKNCLGYPVEFVRDVFGESDVLAKTLKSLTGEAQPRVLIVADLNVVQRTAGLGAKIGKYVQTHGIQLAGSPVVISAGERIKSDNLMSAMQVVSALLEAKLSRNDFVLAIGGGTLLDVAGYAAAQVRGGVRIVRVPTTPAAMMDACYAEYAALDSTNVKDALRVPSSPAAVLIDVTFAESVLDGVWSGAIGEAVRLGMASDAALLKKTAKLASAYAERKLDALSELAEAICAVRTKKGGTSFALWAAGRLESLSGYKLPHGYAVCISLYIDLAYSVEQGLLKKKDMDTAVSILQTCKALDGLVHSQHLMNQTDALLCGLDAWRLSVGSAEVPLVAGIGKPTVVAAADRECYAKVLKQIISTPVVA